MRYFQPSGRCGCECGATGPRLVVLSRRGKSVTVRHAAIRELDFSERQTTGARGLHEAFRAMVKENLAPGSRTVFAPPEGVRCGFILLPKLSPGEEHRGALRIQAMKLLPVDDHSPVMAHVDREIPGARTASVVALGSMTLVRPWCTTIEDTGGVCDEITVKLAAFAALARHQRWFNRHPVCMVADCGAASTWICVLDSHGIRFVREIPVGGDAVTTALTTSLSSESGRVQMAAEEAEREKIAGNLGRLEMLVRAPVERLVGEVQRSISYLRETAGIEVGVLYLTGGASHLRSLRDTLKSSAGVPMFPLDPFADMSFASRAVQDVCDHNRDRLVVATGLALTNVSPLSLLPPHVQALKRAWRYGPAALAALVLAGFVPLLTFGIRKSLELRRVNNTIEQLETRFSPLSNMSAELERLQTGVQQERNKIESLRRTLGRDPMLAATLVSLSEATPPSVILTRFGANYDTDGRGRFILLGRVTSSASGLDASVSSFVSALSASPCFRDVRLVSAVSEKTDSYLGRFEIQCAGTDVPPRDMKE